MKAEELRIGNWVKDWKGGNRGEFQVDTRDITFQKYWHDHDNSITFKPIALTEEWLKKFSFEKVKKIGDRQVYKLHNIECEIIADGRVAIYWNETLFCVQTYVHELQNFFYSNWREELVISD